MLALCWVQLVIKRYNQVWNIIYCFLSCRFQSLTQSDATHLAFQPLQKAHYSLCSWVWLAIELVASFFVIIIQKLCPLWTLHFSLEQQKWCASIFLPIYQVCQVLTFSSNWQNFPPYHWGKWLAGDFQLGILTKVTKQSYKTLSEGKVLLYYCYYNHHHY